jgi:hypothetical protein
MPRTIIESTTTPTATGGTTVTSGSYKYHTFTASGTLTVTAPGKFEALIVSGGGSVGGTAGEDSTFSDITSYGGGEGKGYTGGVGGTGSSGGGAGGPAATSTIAASVGLGEGLTANKILTSLSDDLGHAGGGTSGTVAAGRTTGGGGGGASSAGGTGNITTGVGGDGGDGTSDYDAWLSATSQGVDEAGTRYICGGGGGGTGSGYTGGSGGLGGGGNGNSGSGNAGTTNTGSGAGGGTYAGGGGSGQPILVDELFLDTGDVTVTVGAGGSGTPNGGSGLVIIRYAV